MDYTLLNEELRTKYFQDYDNINNLIEISHWNDFLLKFTLENGNSLSHKQKQVLKNNKDLKSILMIIAGILNNMNKKIIIMIDEIHIYYASKSSENEGQQSYFVDFSYLTT